jgi:hypothetical protein
MVFGVQGEQDIFQDAEIANQVELLKIKPKVSR